jgi:hypothetical protein
MFCRPNEFTPRTAGCHNKFEVFCQAQFSCEVSIHTHAYMAGVVSLCALVQYHTHSISQYGINMHCCFWPRSILKHSMQPGILRHTYQVMVQLIRSVPTQLHPVHSMVEEPATHTMCFKADNNYWPDQAYALTWFLFAAPCLIELSTQLTWRTRDRGGQRLGKLPLRGVLVCRASKCTAPEGVYNGSNISAVVICGATAEGIVPTTWIVFIAKICEHRRIHSGLHCMHQKQSMQHWRLWSMFAHGQCYRHCTWHMHVA